MGEGSECAHERERGGESVSDGESKNAQVGKCENRSVSRGLRPGVREGAGLGVCMSTPECELGCASDCEPGNECEWGVRMSGSV